MLHRIWGWRWVGLALALVFGSSPAFAQGTIVHVQLSTPNPDPNFPWDYQGMRLMGLNPQSYTLDFNGDGTAEFVIYASGPLSTRGFEIWGLGQNRVWSYHPTESWFTVAMNAGETIGPSMMSPWYEWYQTQYYPSGQPIGVNFCSCVGEIGCLGFYAGLGSAYAGLEFQLNGQTHYGWLRVGAPMPEFNGGWIYEYAYDTRPGAAILAGAVPEPSAATLLGLAGVALWLFRRRK
ncbi:MAG TPA: PEP-CTERM sorting domain-containing protein [Verrucomicrobiota bacterium]|jgi:hypothetical protein|nr:MAG: hypothetical protein BWX84_02583 [Verrucomicrobia bacterium ADurb.Bin118]HPY31818.1 PEP-CTERM sorting domain-containing protein [Verrucomicrobiota bacterium]HQB18053.1 PEP-CTERM sorting domain-containing protein [Verrucomicrobiota bacterium]